MRRCDSLDTCEQLVRLAQQQDRDAFASLIPLFERAALALAYSVTGNATVASDVVQDAFLRAWQRLSDLQEPARFGGWFSRIVRNLATDSVRRGPRPAEALDDGFAVTSNGRGAEPSHDPHRQVLQRETAQQITDALATLDELTRSAVVLRYYEDLSSKQIGELLDLSPAAVDMRLSRARAQLRNKLVADNAENVNDMKAGSL